MTDKEICNEAQTARRPAARRRPLGVPAAALALTAALAANSSQAVIPAAERQVLMDLYAGANGPNWTQQNGWTGPVGTECNWYGVHCANGQTNVDGLDLHGNALSGPLPASFTSLSLLRTLDLSNNALRGMLPDFSLLHSLLFVKLGNNQFNGSLPLPPSSLQANQSSVCPNALTISGTNNAAWNAATGRNPWWDLCFEMFVDGFDDPPAPAPDACSAVNSPPGFYRTSAPRVWSDIFTGRSFPTSNSGGYPTSDNGAYTAVAFTTPPSWSATYIRWEQAQAQIVGLEEGSFKYYFTISECRGDFRLGIPGSLMPTEAPACKSIRKNGFGGYDQFNTIFINSTGVSGSSCGLLPNKTYYLNLILEDPRILDGGGNYDPSDGSNCVSGFGTCGVRLFTDQ